MTSPRRSALTSFAVTALVIGATACTLGPEPERPVTAADVGEGYVHALEDAVLELPEVSPWWRSFGDETTVELVELALANNTDLRAAAARVLEAEAGLQRAGGARLPQIGYGVSASEQKNSFVLPEVGRRNIESTTYSYDVNIAWQADLFGRLRRTQQSQWALLLAEEAAQEAVLHAVVASVVRARVALATAAWALEINRDITASWEATTRTVERRYRAGIAGAVELHLARENLAASRASEAVIAAQLEQARLALDVVVGRRPGSAEMPPETLPQLPSLEPVPVGLPLALLDRRPDLRQAEMQLAAATYGVGAALANLYPDLSITGSVGENGDRVNELDLSNFVYNIIGNLTGPLFTGGQRRADVDAARARAEQAAAAYAGAVLNALREVEDALVMGDATVTSFELTSERVDEARAADRIAKERYQRGVEGLLTVLETERRLRLAEQAIITSTSNVWNARIDLHLALGGDWGTDIRGLSDEDAPSESNREAERAAASIGPSIQDTEHETQNPTGV
ncbi:MAG: efflux transporter outer membrane subunit [Thermoanaerobaculales bacterium]|jgi:multidrug efflux system outer membrane protein|nr:efflux transporter outer membrane subunit [Thermoanaerobaculales bacterium]